MASVEPEKRIRTERGIAAPPSVPALPIDVLLPEVLASLQRCPNLVLEAAPGAGKTTRVPPALLGLVAGEVLVLEPRRIAARLAARRVAAEMGEEPGGTVGYQVRFEEVSGPRTRLRFLTEGILTRRLLSDPQLSGVDAVVLDEFHERHLEGDLALALLKRLQAQRPTLQLIVMSATLDAAPVAAFLGGCPSLRSEGRAFPLAIEHLPYSPDPLGSQVAAAVRQLLREEHRGDVLIFLPGAAEIRQAMRACEPLARAEGMLALPLHGDMTPAEQDRAVAPASERKLIFATNVAESSLTIEGVSAVIDSGLARVASYSPWTGLPTLEIRRVSKASAKQRAGRAGRTGPGRVLRLYPEEDYAQRPEQEAPEITRSDLSQLCLALRAMGLPGPSALEWLDAPPYPAVRHAEDLLDRLKAHGTEAGRLSRLPLAPRLARVVLDAIARRVGDAGCAVAALLDSGARVVATDLLTALDCLDDPRALQHLGQLRRLLRSPRGSASDDDELLRAVLAGFPDRVARRGAGSQVQLSTGVSAELAGEPPPYPFMVVLDAEDRRDKPLPLARLTARAEPEWLIDLFPERVREMTRLTWNREAERVEATSALLYDELVLSESQEANPDPAPMAALLADKALEAGLERFVDAEALGNTLARLDFAGVRDVDPGAVLAELCDSLRSFADLRRAATGFLPLLESKLDARTLRELAPATVTLTGGRQTRVHYEQGKPPWIASRLQDFFGMHDTPRIGREKTPLVIQLLAPNGRPVQTTTDLRGFWERLYPQVRRELMRRYPRHAWPEKP